MSVILSNGFSFNCIAASGARGFDGMDGGHGPYLGLYKSVFKFLGYLSPRQIPFITKSITRDPVQGNLKTYAPWKAVRPLGNKSWVNAVALTNPGMLRWLDRYYPTISKYKLDCVVSLHTDNVTDLRWLIQKLNSLHSSRIKAIQLNLSCPNIQLHSRIPSDHLNFYDEMCSTAFNVSDYPLILKLSASDPINDILKRVSNSINVFELINALPWRNTSLGISPLEKYGYQGSVSGAAIAFYARYVLTSANCLTQELKIQLISGGGIVSPEEALFRFQFGAKAISLGVVHFYPWKLYKIIKALHSRC